MVLRKHNLSPYLRTIAKRLFGRITRVESTKTMLEQNKHHETQSPTIQLLKIGATVLASTLLTADLLGHPNRAAKLRTETELCTNDLIDADQTLIWFVGCTQDGQDAYEQLQERIPNVNIIAPRLPEISPSGAIDKKEVCAKVMGQLAATRARHPVIIAESRGALDAVQLVQTAYETGTANAIGCFGRVVFNASPHDGEDITRSRNLLLDGAIGLQYFATADRIKQYVMRRTGHASGAELPITKIVAEGRSIRHAPAVNPIPAVVDELIYVRGAYGDPTIHTAQAAQKYERDAPAGTFREYIDESRSTGMHIGGGERFDLLLDLAGINRPETNLQPQASPQLVWHQTAFAA